MAKTPSQYELRCIVEHAMRRLFQAQDRDWSEYSPDDAQRAEWLEQALTIADQGLEALKSEKGEWKAPRRASLRPVLESVAKAVDSLESA